MENDMVTRNDNCVSRLHERMIIRSRKGKYIVLGNNIFYSIYTTKKEATESVYINRVSFFESPSGLL